MNHLDFIKLKLKPRGVLEITVFKMLHASLIPLI